MEVSNETNKEILEHNFSKPVVHPVNFPHDEQTGLHDLKKDSTKAQMKGRKDKINTGESVDP